MKEFEIWSEGYAATGERGTAYFHGKAKGETFEEACKNFRDSDGEPLGLDLNEDGSLRYDRPSIWACRLFDNEADARKSFG